MSESMKSSLYQLLKTADNLPPLAGALTGELSKLMKDPEGNSAGAVLFTVLALCIMQERGHICIKLDENLKKEVVGALERGPKEEFKTAEKQLTETGLSLYIKNIVSINGVKKDLTDESVSALISKPSPDGTSPLVLDGDLVYFRRQYRYEQDVADFISSKLETAPQLSDPDLNKVRTAADILFTPDPRDEEAKCRDYVDLQKLSAVMAARQPFTVITGGPGTGKTTTVTKLLLLLLCLNPEKDRILLATPTGKASNRMQGSIADQLKGDDLKNKLDEVLKTGLFDPGLDAETLLSKMPVKAVTVHSLIKTVPHRATPLFNQDRRLECDILVVDEVSMLPLHLFSKLCAALKPETKVILLGDKDQLSSVEPGAVLADLCQKQNVSPDYLKTLSLMSGYPEDLLKDKVSSPFVGHLRRSFRFADVRDIGWLAALINHSPDSLEDLKAVEDTKNLETPKDVTFEDPYALKAYALLAKHKDAKDTQDAKDAKDGLRYIHCDRAGQKALAEKTVELSVPEKPSVCSLKESACGTTSFGSFLAYLEQKDFTLSPAEAAEAFRHLDLYRVLCSNRQGYLGTKNINKLIAERVRQIFQAKTDAEWYPGRVVLITKNNPGIGINNGDVGFACYVKGAERKLRVFFPDQNCARALSTAFLSDVEDGFAMTVHKSQGSEYGHVRLLLSVNADNSIMTRELIYTGVTRAKSYVTVCAEPHAFMQACARRTTRMSGLAERILRGDKTAGN